MIQMDGEWVCKFIGRLGPYKLCNHNLYIGIIIFPHIDDTVYRLQLT